MQKTSYGMRISDWSSDVCSSDLDAIADRLFVRAADLPEGEVRVPLKEIHLNRCPALIQWEHLREPDFQRLAIDPAVVEARAARLRAVPPALAGTVRRVFVIGRAHVCTPVSNAHLVCRLLLDKKKTNTHHTYN